MTITNELKLIIERLEKLEDEKIELNNSIKDVLAEAKYKGFDPKIIKMVMRERKLDNNTREEQLHLLDTYRKALS